MIWIVAIGVLVVVVILVIFANSRWAANRGWVYNRHNPRPPGSATPMLLDAIYQPAIEHVIDEQTSEATKADQSESGADDD